MPMKAGGAPLGRGRSAHGIVRSPAMENQVSSQRKTRLTPQEYLELERKAEIKSEYLNGEVTTMPGVSRWHNKICLNLITHLNYQVWDRPCEVFGLDMRLKVSHAGLYTYPDVAALCGKPEFEDDHIDTLLNPQVIIEVLSNSTESYDRGKKFAHYRSLDSLHEYVLVSQSECRVEKYMRQEDGKWLLVENTQADGVIELAAIACKLSLDQVYHRIDFAGGAL